MEVLCYQVLCFLFSIVLIKTLIKTCQFSKVDKLNKYVYLNLLGVNEIISQLIK